MSAVIDRELDSRRRITLSVPVESWPEIEAYAERSGMTLTQFCLYGMLVGCRLLDSVSHPEDFLTPEVMKGLYASVSAEMVKGVIEAQGLKMSPDQLASLLEQVQEQE